MARQRRQSRPQPPVPPSGRDRSPWERGDLAVLSIVALTLAAAPALGVTREEMLQDTLKSAIVAFGTLVAALVLWASRRARSEPLRWHAGLALPVAPMLYALGSMAWSHTYLAGVEAVRWFLFALLMGVTLNTAARERWAVIAWGVAVGGAVASVWAVLQFLFNFAAFPQGPHPASTFVNRNFFAEFAVCTLPFIALLLARARGRIAALLAAMAGVVVLAICMTGTRGALVALGLQLFVAFPAIAWRCRESMEVPRWPAGLKAAVAAIFAAIVLGLGLVPSSDGEILAEGRGSTAIARALQRTASITPGDASLSLRLVMWRATARMVAAHPLAGVGAGAWENDIPLYQAEGSQLETDYYVHNEFLQLVAEYGLVGWAFLAALAAWLLAAAWRTWRVADAAEAAWRGVLLASVGSLLVVSNVGFPWRLASTGALFAVSLGALAASDLRLAGRAARWWGELRLARPGWTFSGVALATSLALATWITTLAAMCEYDIVRATRIVMTISASGAPNDPRWQPAKAQALALLAEGVRINPHYRKITPIAADEFARWGDWPDAIWLWESVLSSRPWIVAILTNTARGYLATGRPLQAAAYVERAKHVQPDAPSVRSAEVLLHATSHDDAGALALGRRAIDEGLVDFDLANAVFIVARRQHDYELAERAMRLRLAKFEQDRIGGWMQLAQMDDLDRQDTERAVAAYAQAWALAPAELRAAVWNDIPERLRPRVAATAPQTSASKG